MWGMYYGCVVVIRYVCMRGDHMGNVLWVYGDHAGYVCGCVVDMRGMYCMGAW